MLNAADGLKNELTILLDRILTNETLTFFGEDGNGQYGRSVFPVSCRVQSFDVEIETYSDDIYEIEALLYITLDGYSASASGHAITDENLRINLNQLLKREYAPVDALAWGPLEKQGENFICLRVDAQKLLQW